MVQGALDPVGPRAPRAVIFPGIYTVLARCPVARPQACGFPTTRTRCDSIDLSARQLLQKPRLPRKFACPICPLVAPLLLFAFRIPNRSKDG